MKYVTVNLSCKRCGQIYQMTKSISDGFEEKLWIEWSRMAFHYCTTCSELVDREREIGYPVLNTVALPFNSSIGFFFSGDTKSIEDELEALAYMQRENLLLVSLRNLVVDEFPLCWGKVVNVTSSQNIFDAISHEISVTKNVTQSYKNWISMSAIETWHRIQSPKRGFPPEPIAPTLVKNKSWNRKLYYETGKIFVKLNDKNIRIKNYEEAAILDTFIREETLYRNIMMDRDFER